MCLVFKSRGRNKNTQATLKNSGGPVLTMTTRMKIRSPESESGVTVGQCLCLWADKFYAITRG